MQGNFSLLEQPLAAPVGRAKAACGGTLTDKREFSIVHNIRRINI